MPSEMDVAFKVAACGVCTALLALVIRRHNAELALCLTIAGCAAMLIAALGLADGLRDALERAREMSGLSSALLSPVVKCAAIGIVCRIGSDACKDAGSAAMASALEFAGALAALWVALPLLSALLDTVEGVLG